jgi:hypothetical protein
MIEAILMFVGPLFPLMFTNNLVMSFVKYISRFKNSKLWLRGTLVILSAMGLISYSALMDQPVDFNQLSDLGQLLAQVIILAFGSHFSYRTIKEA